MRFYPVPIDTVGIQYIQYLGIQFTGYYFYLHFHCAVYIHITLVYGIYVLYYMHNTNTVLLITKHQPFMKLAPEFRECSLL